MRNLMWGLVLASVAGLYGGAALAQTPPDFSFAEGSSKFLTTQCNAWRVSESPLNSRARKLLGKSTAGICRDVAEKWSGRFVEWHQSKDGSAPLRAFAEICREVAEKLAGRPVEVVWCSSWQEFRNGHMIPAAGPPDEVWNALDASPLEGIGAKRSSRDELLRELLGGRLRKEWDQVQVKTDMEAIGFVCEVWRRNEKLDITITTSEFTCRGNASEIVGAPSKPLFLFRLQINVTVTFAEASEARGWQQIEVKTGEAHL
jgi:hypothetical protein